MLNFTPFEALIIISQNPESVFRLYKILKIFTLVYLPAYKTDETANVEKFSFIDIDLIEFKNNNCKDTSLFSDNLSARFDCAIAIWRIENYSIKGKTRILNLLLIRTE